MHFITHLTSVTCILRNETRSFILRRLEFEGKDCKVPMGIFGNKEDAIPNKDVSTLLWWWGSRDSVTWRAMPAVVYLLVGPPMLERSKGRV
jgi:hypothetical protein